VQVIDRADALGGIAAITGPGRSFVDWLAAECARLGVAVQLNTPWPTDAQGSAATAAAGAVVQATGGRVGVRDYQILDGATVLDIVDVRRGVSTLPQIGVIVVIDPIGGPIAVGLAEELGERAVLVTQDQIAGNELSRSGDLAPANVRLAQRGVRIERRSVVRVVRPNEVELEDRFSGARRTVQCAAVVDCGFRLATDRLPGVDVMVGDCVAPRTILEAVLDGRRAAAGL
jgi:2,4-dienoyl-CoA reductase (NADPH2)